MSDDETPDDICERAAVVIDREVRQNHRALMDVARQLAREGVEPSVIGRAFVLAVERVHRLIVTGELGFYELTRLVHRFPFSHGWPFALVSVLTIPATLLAAYILVAVHHPGPYGLIGMAAAAMACGFVFWFLGISLVYLALRTKALLRRFAK